MGNIKENYGMMFTSYPDLVNIKQLTKMLGIGIILAYRLVKNNIVLESNGETALDFWQQEIKDNSLYVKTLLFSF